MKYYCECQHEWEANDAPEKCPQCGSYRFMPVSRGCLSVFLSAAGIIAGVIIGGGLVIGFDNPKVYIVAFMALATNVFSAIANQSRFHNFVRHTKIEQAQKTTLSEPATQTIPKSSIESSTEITSELKIERTFECQATVPEPQSVSFQNPFSALAVCVFIMFLFFLFAGTVLVLYELMITGLNNYLLPLTVAIFLGVSFIISLGVTFGRAFNPERFSFDSESLSFEINHPFFKKQYELKWDEIRDITVKEKDVILFGVTIGYIAIVKVVTFTKKRSFVIRYSSHGAEGNVFVKKLCDMYCRMTREKESLS